MLFSLLNVAVRQVLDGRRLRGRRSARSRAQVSQLPVSLRRPACPSAAHMSYAKGLPGPSSGRPRPSP